MVLRVRLPRLLSPNPVIRPWRSFRISATHGDRSCGVPLGPGSHSAPSRRPSLGGPLHIVKNLPFLVCIMPLRAFLEFPLV
jgi:hypothetical protein